MKKKVVLLAWLWLALIAGMTCSCSDDDEDTPAVVPQLSLVENTWTFPRLQADYKIGVFSNVKWQATTDAAWLTLKNNEGDGNGSFTVSLPENKSGGVQVAKITVKALQDEKLIATFDITQEATILNVTASENINIPAEGQTLTIGVEGNVDYSFKMGEWVKVAAAPGTQASAFCALTKSQIVINIDANPGVEARQCDLLILSGPEEIKKLHITQEGAVPVAEKFTVVVNGKLPDSRLNIGKLGGEITFRVVSNLSFEYEASDWINPGGGFAGVGDTTGYKVHVGANLSGSYRDKLFQFKTTGEGLDTTVTVRIRQEPLAATDFRLSVLSDFPAEGGTAGILIETEEAVSKALACRLILPENSLVKPDGEFGFGKSRLSYEMENPAFEPLNLGTAVVQIYDPQFIATVIELEAPLTQAAVKRITTDREGIIMQDYQGGTITYTVLNVPQKKTWDCKMITTQEKIEIIGGHEVITTTNDTLGLDELPAGYRIVTDQEQNTLTLTYPENESAEKMQLSQLWIYCVENPQNSCMMIVQQGKNPNAYSLKATDITLANASVAAASLVATVTPPDGVVKAVIENDPHHLLTIAPEADWSRMDGSNEVYVTIPLTITPNTEAVEKTAEIRLQLYKADGVTLKSEKTIRVTQPARLAQKKLIAQVMNPNAIYDMRPATLALSWDDGSPVSLSELQFKMLYEGQYVNAGFISAEEDSGTFALFFMGGGPEGALTICIYTGEWDESKISNYALVDLQVSME